MQFIYKRSKFFLHLSKRHLNTFHSQPSSSASGSDLYSYILSRNLSNTDIQENWLAINNSKVDQRGIYATVDLPAGTLIVDEEPVATVLHKRGPSNPYDQYCPHCLNPQPPSGVDDTTYDHIYCSVECATDAMMVHQIKEHNELCKVFYGQVRHYPIMGLNLILECLKQFKLLNRSPVYRSLPLLGYVRQPKLPEQWQDDYELIKSRFLKDSTRQNYFSIEWYARTQSILDMNAFRITDSSDANKPIGSGLYLLSSFFNHQCIQAGGQVSFQGSRIQVHLTRDIKRGEQIHIPYLDPDQFASNQDRISFLERKYGFRCQCPLCIN